MLQALATFGLLVVAVGSGLWGWSMWWLALFAFLAGSLSIANGPMYDKVISANQRGSLTVFPIILFIQVGAHFGVACAARWATNWFT